MELEILKKLLESDVLSEETKTELQTQFKSSVDAYLAEERIKLEAQLTEEFVKAREELTTAVDAKVDAFLAAEMKELHEDIDAWRDLEVEAAEREVELKEAAEQREAEMRSELRAQLNEELEALVDKLDAFLELNLKAEYDELREDIEEAKKLKFGQKVFEAFEATFKAHRSDDMTKTERELAEALDRLADAEAKIALIEKTKEEEIRNAKLDEVLAPLAGTARETMKTILTNVKTDRLTEAYKAFLPRILKDNMAAETTGKEKLNESASGTKVTVTGNEETIDAPKKPSNDSLARMRKLAGLA